MFRRSEGGYTLGALLGMAGLLVACAGPGAGAGSLPSRPSTIEGLAFSTAAMPAGSPSKTVLYALGVIDGKHMVGAPIIDAHDDVFGSTFNGGGQIAGGWATGTVYELIRSGSHYRHTMIRGFRSDTIGVSPGPIRMDAGGNLWGIASRGVFEITPDRRATLVYPCRGGNNPTTGVTIAGNSIYGVCGNTVFVLTGAGGKFAENTIYTFGLPEYPNGDLHVDASGALYGTTCYGGNSPQGAGSVYKLIRTSTGYREYVLYSFRGRPHGNKDGESPLGGVYVDGNGALYGTTQFGGTYGNGTAYELRPDGSGTYTERIIDQSANLNEPTGTIVADASGALYFTTLFGGANYQGSVIKLTRSGNDFTETVLSHFDDRYLGASPSGTLLIGPAGNIFGVTEGGGTHDNGVLYSLRQAQGDN